MTKETMSETAVLKTDTVGRVQTPHDRRETLLEEFDRSGLSAARFATLVGIKYSTFAAWVARRRKQRGEVSAPARAGEPVRWLEAVVRDAQTPVSRPVVPLTLRLPGGRAIELNGLDQVELAAALVRALEKGPAPC